MLTTFLAIGIVMIFDSILFFFARKKLNKIEKKQQNHHEFLLKVKNDIPIIHHKIHDLEEQILPPQDELKEMH